MGVFAVEAIPAATSLGRVRGRLHHGADYGSEYCIELDEKRSLEPRAPFRFLNHSCRPNCELVHVSCEQEDGSIGVPEIWVDTLRAIEPGEQLTIDYGWTADAAIPCGCGVPQCRGWIVASDEVPRLLDVVVDRMQAFVNDPGGC
jgi:hypothetical protein